MKPYFSFRVAALFCCALISLLAGGCDNTKSGTTKSGTDAPPLDGTARQTGNALETDQSGARRTLPTKENGAATTSGTEGEDERPGRAMDPLASRVFDMIAELTAGVLVAEDRPKMEARLEASLAELGLGDSEGRLQVSRLVVGTMIDESAKARNAAAGGRVVPAAIREQAIKAMANEVASELYRRLPKGQPAHTGTLAPAKPIEVPPGFETPSWALLGGFEFVEGEPIPKEVMAFNSKKIGISGYMMTLEEVEDIHEFLLVESMWSCCFGTIPRENQVIVVTIPTKKGIEYTSAPLLVLGTMDIGEEREDGFVISVHRLKAEKVKEIE